MKLALIGILLLLPIFMVPAFAQYSYTQASIPIPSQLQGASNFVNQTMTQVSNAKSITDSILDGLKQIINSIIGAANIQGNSNPLNLTSSKLQGVSNSGFKVVGDLGAVGWDFNGLMTNLINSFSPIKIPFWIVAGISAIITLVALIKIGKMAFQKGVIIIGLILIGILLLMVIGIHNSVVT